MATNFWQKFDIAFCRGDLLNLGSEISSANLQGIDYDTADLVFRAEAGTLDGSNHKYSYLLDKLGQEGPSEHSARAALGYAHSSFFVGAWQISLDALHQSVVTAIQSENARSTDLRRLRTEAYLRLADYWTLFRHPGMVLSYLNLASKSFPESSTRIYSRLRLLFSNEGSNPGALMQLVAQGKWGTTYFRMVDRVFSDLPQMNLSRAPSIEDVEISEGPKAGFEVCLSEALNLKIENRLSWALKAVSIAERMKVPAWVAVADITVSFLAGRESNLDLARKHLARSLPLIKNHNLEGLLVYAMLANLPIIEFDFGRENASNQVQLALNQILAQAELFRDIVVRRRFIWVFEKLFIDAFKYAQKASKDDIAFMSILKCKGFGWATLKPVESSENDILQSRNTEIAPLMLGEDLLGPNSMRNNVVGPHQRLPGIYGEVDDMLQLSDTIARSELLQLVRENVFGMSTSTQITSKPLSENIMEIYFVFDDERIWRIDRLEKQINFVPLTINYGELNSDIMASGLSTTMANRIAPVDYAPIEKSVENLLADLPDQARHVNHIRIWPHGLLYSIPFTYAVRSFLPQNPLVSCLLSIEETSSNFNHRKTSAVRLAPLYMGEHNLPYAASEVRSLEQKTDIVLAEASISADSIIRYLIKAPSLFHFAGHAINRNDHPELAGLYASDLTLVSVADILNIGCGPKAAVLSACETGPGPLHSADGSYSLPRAFLQIGSKWVLASLWRIGDKETYTFMKLFFEKLRKGLEPEAALPRKRHPFVLYRAG